MVLDTSGIPMKEVKPQNSIRVRFRIEKLEKERNKCNPIKKCLMSGKPHKEIQVKFSNRGWEKDINLLDSEPEFEKDLKIKTILSSTS